MNRWMLVFGLVAAFGLAGSPCRAQDESTPKLEKPSKEGRAALKQAASIRREARGQELEEKRAVYRRTAEAYEGILETFADEPAVRIEARFRLAELNRLLGDVDRATELYEQVTTEKPAGAFGARARSEIAHLYRRAKQYGNAQEHYARVWQEHADQSIYGARAMIWAGKCAARDGRLEEGRALWRDAIAKYEMHPAQVVRAFDALADSHLDAGDRAGAEAVIAECEQWIESVSTPDSEERQDARDSFGKMSTRKKLAKLSGGDR